MRAELESSGRHANVRSVEVRRDLEVSRENKPSAAHGRLSGAVEKDLKLAETTDPNAQCQ